jgi:hypothetical protein
MKKVCSRQITQTKLSPMSLKFIKQKLTYLNIFAQTKRIYENKTSPYYVHYDIILNNF